ncbi:phytanoyl-CoA dioxygenase family protein [Allorhizocola rhizosphaerae]|uniref:phytanoyl-CoA dioxygenase family protein n=1 Tax=Allorhizocola rhizosphaerae TaxID=1872709 RepID=UPI000E3C677E|nr:phytanoyl-CoA dioxygenase family protein [Allorhizocola rhizosphaerae]
MTDLLEASPGEALTNDQRAAFEHDGFVVLPGVLSADDVAHYTSLVDALYDRELLAGRLPRGGALHRLSAVHTCPELAPLIDHPRLLGPVWSILGWNIHIYHSHVDVHPTVRGPKPPRFEWHQDGGRQNRELETDPRPRLSVKGVYWLSDVSQPGRGNFKVVPGSHITNWIDGPPRRNMSWPDPPGAIEVVANPGDVVLFDRRIWHARSDNFSEITRKAVFFAYTYRWVVGRDQVPDDSTRYTAVQRQLLGLLDSTDGDHAWGHEPAQVPLHGVLAEAGLLDPAVPALKP